MPATSEAVLKAVMRLQGEEWEIPVRKNPTDDINTDSHPEVKEQFSADGKVKMDNKDKAQPVPHAEDTSPPKSAGEHDDEQPEAIKDPNVSVARGPAHSE
ncbi:MAG TPA: hypothetical protein DCP60_08770 [Psychrobacter sp.]|nr:hypothetical protein [Psychrobacter sp.]